MGKILVTLGGVVVIILFAALVVPYFIDWNHYKNEIESRSSAFFGRPIHIDGQITVRLLPQPVLRIHNVRIDSVRGKRFFEARAIEARLAIEPLLRKNIEITHIELVKPVLRLIRGENGSGNWKPAAGDSPALAGTDHVSVQNLHIQDGRIVYRDEVRKLVKSVESINADLNATSLRGPFKVSGTFGEAGSAFKIASSRLGTGGSLRLTSRITGAFGDGRLSGQLQNLFEDASFSGKVTFRRKKSRNDRLAVSAESRVSLIDSVLKLEDLAGTIGEGSAAMRYQGALSLAWKNAPRFTGKFSARRADLDALLGTTGNADKARLLMALVRRAPAVLPEGLGGGIDLNIAGGLIGGKSFSELTLKLVSNGGKLSISGLNVMLPGQSGLKLAGDFIKEGTTPLFSGNFELETPDLRQFLNWVGYDGALKPQRGALRFSLASQIRLTPQRVELRQSSGKLGNAGFSGFFMHDHETSALRLKASINALDLDRYFKAGKDDPGFAPLSFSLVRPSKWAKRFPALLRGKSDLSLNIGELRHKGRVYKGFAGDLRFNNGDLAIHQIAYSTELDESVSLSGNIANLPTKPQTYLQIKLVTPSLARAVPAFVLHDLPELEGGLAGLGAADLDLRFTGVEDAKQVRMSLRGSGELAGAGAQIEAGFSGVPERAGDGQLNWRLRLENASARDLLDQLKIPKIGEPWGAGKGKGVFEWKGKGTINLLLAFSARLDLPGAKFSLKGTIEKDKSYRFSDVRFNLRLEDSAILERRLTGRAGRHSAKIPLTLSASLDGGRSDLVIAGASGAAGGAPYTAYGRMKLDGKRPEISLNLKPGRFDLPLLLEILFGVEGANNDAGRVAGFPSSVLDASRLKRFALRLEVETPQMALSKNLFLKQAVLSLRTGSGVFEVQTLSGQLMSASLLGSVRLEDDGNGILRGQAGLVLENLRLKDILKSLDGREAVKGVVSLKADLETDGRSLAGLVSTLRGSSDIRMSGGEVLIPDLFASSLIAGAAQSADELEKAMKNSIGWRLTPYVPGALRARISNGVLRIENAAFAMNGGTGNFNLVTDFTARKLDARWQFPLPNLKDAPLLGIAYSGPYSRLAAQVDYSALMRFITRRQIEREAEESRKEAIKSKTDALPTGVIKQNVIDLPGLAGKAAQ